MELNEIKKKYSFPLEEFYKSVGVKAEDFSWLIEQAEKFEEQQKELERLQGFIENLQVVHFVEVQREKATVERYEKVLKYYADRDFTKAKEALE